MRTYATAVATWPQSDSRQSRWIALLLAVLLALSLVPISAGAQNLAVFESEIADYTITYDPAIWTANPSENSTNNAEQVSFLESQRVNVVQLTAVLGAYSPDQATDCVLTEAEGFLTGGAFQNLAEFPASDSNADDLDGFINGTYFAVEGQIALQGGLADIVLFFSCAILEADLTIVMTQIADRADYQSAWSERQDLLAGFSLDGSSSPTAPRTIPQQRTPTVVTEPDPTDAPTRSRRGSDRRSRTTPEATAPNVPTTRTTPTPANESSVSRPDQTVTSVNRIFALNYDSRYWTVNDNGFDTRDQGDYIVLGSEKGVFRVAQTSNVRPGDMSACVLEYASRYLDSDGSVIDWAFLELEDGSDILLEDDGNTAVGVAAVIYQDNRGTFEYAYILGCVRLDASTALTIIHVVTIDDFEAELPYVLELIDSITDA